MDIQVGRLIDHLHLRVADLAASRRFYDAILGSLGLKLAPLTDRIWRADEFLVSQVEPGGSTSRVHLAFQARDRQQVDAFYRAALGAGGKDNGPPGERPYHPGYYACFVHDPDGSNIEAVYHGPGRRSAEMITIEPI